MSIPDLGLKIRTMRLSRNLTQQDLGKLVGVSQSAIGMWENNKREPDFKALEALADVFNVPLSSLVDKSETPWTAADYAARGIAVRLEPGKVSSGKASTGAMLKQLMDEFDKLEELSDDERELLGMYRRLEPDTRDAIKRFAKSFLNDSKKL